MASPEEIQSYIQLAAALEPLAEKVAVPVAQKLIIPLIEEIEHEVLGGIGALFNGLRAKANTPPT